MYAALAPPPPRRIARRSPKTRVKMLAEAPRHASTRRAHPPPPALHG
jgi:hypothetical protein